MIKPPLIKPGDRIAIVASAKTIGQEEVVHFCNFLNEKDFEVDALIDGPDGMFAGSDQQRADRFNQAIADPDIKAIWMARGGYGSIRMRDLIDWEAVLAHPKWLIGYSDVTVLHHAFNARGIQTIHGPMAIDLSIHENPRCFEMTLDILQGKSDGESTGHAPLKGGNLAILHNLLASGETIVNKGDVLLIEEVGEALYAIDRMLQAFKLKGVFDQISGLLVGGITAIEPSEPEFGKTAMEIIEDVCAGYDFPIQFNVPVGHQKDNRPVVLG